MLVTDAERWTRTGRRELLLATRDAPRAGAPTPTQRSTPDGSLRRYADVANDPRDLVALLEDNGVSTSADRYSTEYGLFTAGPGIPDALMMAMVPPGSLGGGGGASRAVSRALVVEDLGLPAGTTVNELRGTVINAGTTRVISVDMIDFTGIHPFTLRAGLSRMVAAARADGVSVLQINATIARARLYRVVTDRVEALGGTVQSAGSETFTFVLGR